MTPVLAADLAATWRAMVGSRSAQAARLRPASGDHGSSHDAGEHLVDDVAPELPAVVRFARADETWTDIGAGDGRLALVVAHVVRALKVVEPDASAARRLEERLHRMSTLNLAVHALRWPPAAPVDGLRADVVAAAHVLYDIAEPVPFIEAMEAHAGRACVVVMAERAPSSQDARIFRAVHGELPAPLPALDEALALLRALDRDLIEVVTTPPIRFVRPVSIDLALDLVRSHFWVVPGTPEDDRLRDAIWDAWGRDGLVALPPHVTAGAVVAWRPRKGALR